MYWVITRSALDGCHKCWCLKTNKPVWQFSWKSQSVQCRSGKVSSQICNHGQNVGSPFWPRVPSYKVKHGNIPSHSCQSNSARLPPVALLWHQYFGTVRVFSWLITWRGKDCYGQLLCGINQKTLYSYQRKEIGKVESRSAASSQQCTSPRFCCCHSCYSRLQLWTAESPAVFSRPGSIWHCVPIFEKIWF